MVMGGTQSPYASIPHSSTELLVHGASSWTTTGSLPASIEGGRGTNIDNKVLVMGKCKVLNRSLLPSLSLVVVTKLKPSYPSLTSLFVGGYGGGWVNDVWYLGFLDDVYEYDEVLGVWTNIGKMSMRKSGHALSVINFNEVKDYTNCD